ncbi:hypothetical protein Dvina_51505 [Dactylosporangium vinaceum]|uniref:Uncharacterized protein n=1 Tax=Dactylosporangium vinaceum TaxID=53362 RepID=A0ABV5M2G9_9ACTN|nr:hypothetical protein [Dactylosporangium vinaceum]UAB96274.1 hypothetical protein Dvina_51505 [Dactylosporangium vinaceum]
MLAIAARIRPSANVAVPDDVTDVLLWQLAFDVAVEHQRGPDGDCANLRCAGQRGPCDAAVQAQRALRAARRPTAAHRPALPQTTQATASPPTVVPNPHPGRAIGQAAVPPPNAGRFTGWFTQTATAAVNRWRTQLPRRVPGEALAAA